MNNPQKAPIAFRQWTRRRLFGLDNGSFFEIISNHNDRGDYLLHLVATNVDDRHFPRYFFNSNNAALEAEAWLRRWDSLDSGYRYAPPDLAAPIWSLTGKDCVIELCTVANHLAIGSYAGFVRVTEDKKDMFVVDAPDLFPRFYFHQAIAIAELTAWMVRREQI